MNFCGFFFVGRQRMDFCDYLVDILAFVHFIVASFCLIKFVLAEVADLVHFLISGYFVSRGGLIALSSFSAVREFGTNPDQSGQSGSLGEGDAFEDGSEADQSVRAMIGRRERWLGRTTEKMAEDRQRETRRAESTGRQRGGSGRIGIKSRIGHERTEGKG